MSANDSGRVRLGGITLIEASAGTGKTHAIGTRYLELVVDSGLRVDQILVLTFTKGATAELRSRLRARLRAAIEWIDSDRAAETLSGDESFLARARSEAKADSQHRLRAALHGFDEAAIFTIHGFCQRLLREHAFESGADFETELAPDVRERLDDAARDFWVQRLHDADVAFVHHTRKQRGGFEGLRRLVQQRLGHPDARLTPVQLPEPNGDLGPLLEAEAAARRAAAALWQQDRPGILAALSSPSLNRARYPLKSIAVWPARFDAAFALDAPGAVGRCKELARVSQRKLNDATKKNCAPPTHPFFEACDRLVDTDSALTQLLDLSLDHLQRDACELVPAALRAEMRRAHVHSFDDLLREVVEALAGPTGNALTQTVRNRFAAALIDEFQDTDPTQYEILSRLFLTTGATVVFVGDPKQAIYSFRGADIHAYLRARSADGVEVESLAVNWRSDPSMLTALNAFFGSHPDPFRSAAIQYHHVDPKPGAVDRLHPAEQPALQFLELPVDPQDPDVRHGTLSVAAARSRVARGVACEIAALLAGRHRIADDGTTERDLRAGDIAVLCRSNQQVHLVQRQLRRLSIPSVSQSESSVFDSEAAVEMLRIVQAMATPRDVRALNAALATTLLGVDAPSLDALHNDEVGWDGWGTRFVELHERWTHEGFMSAFQHLLSECAVRPRVLACVGGERLITDAQHIAELMHQAEASDRLAPQALLRWLGRMGRDAAARERMAGEDAHVRLESDEDAVKLVTIHKSKGLEYGIVFCPFLWGNPLGNTRKSDAPRAHDPERGHVVLAIGKEDQTAAVRQLMDDEVRAEEQRLLYVALTRAKHRCYIVTGSIRDAEKSPLGHLLGASRQGKPTASDEDEGDMSPAAARVATLASSSAGAIGRRRLCDEPPDRGGAQPSREIALTPPRAARRGAPPAAAVSSFTALIAHADSDGAEDVIADRDQGSATQETTPSTAPVVVERRVRLHALPKGAQTGTMLHEILERLDFSTATLDGIRRVSSDRLRRQGFDAVWADTIGEALQRVLATPLPHDRGEVRLADVSAENRVVELDFVLPAARDGQSRAMRAAAIEAAFRDHAVHPGVRTWAGRLEPRRLAPAFGYLKGYIDIVFRDATGRYFLADYKSNALGEGPESYGDEALLSTMDEHDYYLQYHLYALALVRYLARRIPEFDYDRHFGGAFYLFLRGMDPEHPRGTGIYFDRPPRALIEQLDAAITGEES